MASILDLNNAFVYYVDRINPGRSFADIISVINSSGVELRFAGDASDVRYNPPIDSLLGEPKALLKSTFVNKSDAMDQQTFKHSLTETASFSTSFTEGVKIGAETKLKTKIPFIAEGEVTLSAEGSFSSTQNDTSTQSQAFEFNSTINVPPRSRVVATAMIDSLRYVGTLTAKVQVAGRIFINFGSTSLQVDVADVFKAIKSRPPGNYSVTDKRTTYTFTDSDLALFEVTPTNEVLFSTTAAIEAKYGASTRIDVQQYDLSSGKMVREFTL